jgi:hypothetical protein
VRVFHTGKEKFLDDKGVEEFFGVAPGQVVDVLALMGDSSDNIPGVPRVGAVTAKKWIREYGSLDRLLEKAGEVKGKVGESLREHTEDALLSRRLAAIRTDLPIPFDTEALKRSAPDAEKLKELFVELEFHSLAAEIQGEVAQAALSSNRLEKGKAFDVAPGEWAGVALLTRNGHGLLAAGGGSNVSIAEGPAAEIRERWTALERSGAKLAIPDAKPLDRLLQEAGRNVPHLRYDAETLLASGGLDGDGDPHRCGRAPRGALPPCACRQYQVRCTDDVATGIRDRHLVRRNAAYCVDRL